MWSVVAVIASIAVALGLVIGVEAFSAVYHPFPPGVDATDPEVCAAHVAKYPAWLLFVCGLGWGAAAFATSWTATRLGTRRHPAHGYTLGAPLLLAAGFNIAMLPYPTWFTIESILLLPLGVYLGTRLGRCRATRANEE